MYSGRNEEEALNKAAERFQVEKEKIDLQQGIAFFISFIMIRDL